MVIFMLLPMMSFLRPGNISVWIYCYWQASCYKFKAVNNSFWKMDIETNNTSLPSQSLFTPLTEAFSLHHNQTSILATSCSLSTNTYTHHTLNLLSNTLLLEHPSSLTLAVSLCFELKFQVLYQLQKNVQSPKIGIRLYNQSEKQLIIYLEQYNADTWARILQKRLNQKGFHQMFKPIKKLGKGNFATVYQAERVTDRRRFAVKAFSKQNSYSSKNGKESLINELNVLRELNKQPHHNVLKLQAVYQSQNSIYVVLELLTGKTLYQIIQERKGVFVREQIQTIVRGLLDGLKHLHSNRIMHRDLKPQNIMLRGNSLEPVIVDFGLATNVDLKEYLFFRCGTPGYVAPQIIKLAASEHIEPICDVFSLGAIFHILLVRKPLFQGTKYDQVYRNNKEFNCKLQGQHFNGVEFTAVDLLRKMLILNPSVRISALRALSHEYFTGQTQGETQVKLMNSPALTSVGSTVKKEKRKKMFIFF